VERHIVNRRQATAGECHDMMKFDLVGRAAAVSIFTDKCATSRRRASRPPNGPLLEWFGPLAGAGVFSWALAAVVTGAVRVRALPLPPCVARRRVASANALMQHLLEAAVGNHMAERRSHPLEVGHELRPTVIRTTCCSAEIGSTRAGDFWVGTALLVE